MTRPLRLIPIEQRLALAREFYGLTPEPHERVDPVLVPTAEWIPYQPSDPAEWMDREPPTYARDDEDQ